MTPEHTKGYTRKCRLQVVAEQHSLTITSAAKDAALLTLESKHSAHSCDQLRRAYGHQTFLRLYRLAGSASSHASPNPVSQVLPVAIVKAVE
jgi:hypothetical protein